MGFESPYVLFGLLAIGVPAAIHIFITKRALHIPMDMVLFLVGSLRPYLRTLHALLLASRILIICIAVMIFSEPYLLLPSQGDVSGQTPSAFALVLDNSMSMSLSIDGVTNFNRAKSIGAQAIEELHPESEVFIVEGSKPVSTQLDQEMSMDKNKALGFLSKSKQTFRGTDLAQAVKVAISLVRSSPYKDKRVLVLSDFFDHALQDFPEKEETYAVRLRAHDLAPAKPRNRAVIDADASPAPDISPRHMRIKVSILNDQEIWFDDVVSLKIGKDVLARKLKCEPYSQCSQEFLVSIQEGIKVGQAKIPPDNLPEDDVRFFSIAQHIGGAVLIVDGTRSVSTRIYESFFLERALNLSIDEDKGFFTTTIHPEEFSPLHLEGVSVVALINIRYLTGEQISALSSFVEKGGGLFISFGENMQSETWKTMFSPLLPAPPRDIIEMVSDQQATLPTIGFIDLSHPCLTDMISGNGSLSSVEVYKYVFLEPGWGHNTTSLINLRNSAPLLVETKLGKGIIMILLTTIDMDWTDLPLRPVFAPFIRRLFAYLRDFKGHEIKHSLIVGEQKEIEIPQGYEKAIIVDPSGTSTTIGANQSFSGTETPGVYEIYFISQEKKEKGGVFVVNTPPSESKLRKTLQVPSILREDGETRVETTKKLPLWPYLFVVLLGLFIVEAYLRAKT